MLLCRLDEVVHLGQLDTQVLQVPSLPRERKAELPLHLPCPSRQVRPTRHGECMRSQGMRAHLLENGQHRHVEVDAQLALAAVGPDHQHGARCLKPKPKTPQPAKAKNLHRQQTPVSARYIQKGEVVSVKEGEDTSRCKEDTSVTVQVGSPHTARAAMGGANNLARATPTMGTAVAFAPLGALPPNNSESPSCAAHWFTIGSGSSLRKNASVSSWLGPRHRDTGTARTGRWNTTRATEHLP
jgi:hypothetical protein